MRLLLLSLFVATGCSKTVEQPALPSQPPRELEVPDRTKLPVGNAKPEVYHSPEYIAGTYTRYPLRAELRQAIIERHNLKQVATDSSDVEFFLRQYPPHWPEISVSDSTWYAWPYNRGAGDRNLQINYILVIDETSSTMCLLAQNHDVTP